MRQRFEKIFKSDFNINAKVIYFTTGNLNELFIRVDDKVRDIFAFLFIHLL